MSEWRKTLVPADTPISDVLVQIGKSRQKIALVVDPEHKLLGTVTDGDVRRSILSKVPVESPISDIMNADPISISPITSQKDQLDVLRKRSIQHLPIVSESGVVVGLVTLNDLLSLDTGYKPNRVVLMVGGLGTRLRPLTDDTPKPLLNVAGQPLLETIVRQLAFHGFRRIYLAVNHMAEAIKAYFRDGQSFGVEITYLEEEQKLGTAGPLGLITETPSDPLVVMNGDILTNVDFSALLAYHLEHRSAVTVATRSFDVQVPFGVVEARDHAIREIVEKPIYSYQVNAGIYAIAPSVLDHVSGDSAIDMPDLIRALIDDGQRVTSFPMHEYWIDIGRKEDLNRAAGEFSDVFS